MLKSRISKVYASAMLTSLLLIGLECSKASSPTTVAAATRLAVSPQSDTLQSGQTIQLSAAVTWSDGQSHPYSVSYSTAAGSVTTAGLVTAGAVAGTFSVVSTCTCNLADTSRLTVVRPRPTITTLVLTPKSLTLAAGASRQFSVADSGSGGSSTPLGITYVATGGTISTAGLYTAGTIPGSFCVIARQSGTLVDTAIVTISAPPLIAPNFAHPFSATSPWNSPISAYQSASYQSVSVFPGFTAAMATWPGALWVAMYQATAGDPVVHLYFNTNAWINVANGTWHRSGNSPAVEAAIRAGSDQLWGGYEANMYSTTTASQDSSGYTMPATFHARESNYWSLTPHVPVGALPPPDADGHMTVFQPNGWALEMLSPIVLSNGDIVTMFASYTDPTGLGAGDENGRRATMVPNYAGLVRNGELASGHIQHALSVALGAEALRAAIVWPAVAMDRTNRNYRGTIPMGALLAIPATVDLTTLGLQTPQGRTLAAAAQSYGLYVVDQAGPRYFLIATERNVTDVPPWSGPLAQDLGIIMAQVKLTTLGAHK